MHYNDNNLTDADFVGIYKRVREEGGGLKRIAELGDISIDQVKNRIHIYI